MFSKVKNYAAKKLIQSQLKNVPEAQREMIMTLFENNPQLMEKIAKEIKAEQDKGANQMTAAMKVLPKYQKEIAAAMPPEMLQKMAQMQGGAAGRFNPNGSIR